MRVPRSAMKRRRTGEKHPRKISGSAKGTELHQARRFHAGGFFFGFAARAAQCLRGVFQSDVLWCGLDYRRTEPSSPPLLEASLKVKRNNAHGWNSRPGSPQHSE